jgi:hypothetical protein
MTASNNFFRIRFQISHSCSTSFLRNLKYKLNIPVSSKGKSERQVFLAAKGLFRRKQNEEKKQFRQRPFCLHFSEVILTLEFLSNILQFVFVLIGHYCINIFKRIHS